MVVMTAWGNVPLAVEALRRGADDFIEKPWDNARLLSIVRNRVHRAGRGRAAAVPTGGGERAAARWQRRGVDRGVAGDAAGDGAGGAGRAQAGRRTCWCWARTAPARA
ncbi:hypothetical protein [Rhodanobacter lindaniclasticus]